MTSLAASRERDELYERVRSVLRKGAGAAMDAGEFERLALAALAWQRSVCPALDRAIRAASDGVTARGLEGVVGVATDAFKAARIATFAPEREARVFYTSGTTGEARGRHALETMELYELAAIAAARRWLLPAERYRFVLLAESEERNPHSSLSAMLSMFLKTWGDDDDAFCVDRGRLLVDKVRARVDRARAEGAAVAMLGATFAFVHLWDVVGDAGSVRLPPGSVVMPTGGFKGRSRELSNDELMSEIQVRFGVSRGDVVQEYGMTELCSQAYEAHREGVEPGRYVCPPWMRVDAVDIETLAVLPQGEEGILRVIDLANLSSCVAVQTADVGVVHRDGFVVKGRLAGATPRGCARAMDALLGG